MIAAGHRGRRATARALYTLLAASTLLTGSLSRVGASRAGEVPPVLDRTRFIGVDEITPGMRGVGRTTFSRDGIAEFQVEVLGVLRSWVPGGDLIVIEASGGRIADTGVFRGMSGSPVYLNGRLAGAVAYNLGGFAERPIAGVTPIAEMLPLMTASHAGSAAPESPLNGASWLPGIDEGPATSRPDEDDAPTSTGSVPGPGTASGDIQPIGTPLVLAGFTPQARAALAPLLSRFGLEAVSGGASGGGTGTPTRLEPGAPVGVQIVRGDVEVTALGTVTYVDGDRVLAFGHPMFQAGPVDLPMTSAEVITVYPSQAISFVIGNADAAVGHVTMDQLSGISGQLGPAAPMVPVSVLLRESGNERRYHFEIVRNKFFLSQFVGVVALNSFTADEKAFGDATLDLALTVELADGTKLAVRDLLASIQAPAALAERVSAPVSTLLFNSVEPLEIRRVDLEVNVQSTIRAAAIEELIANRYEVAPGDSIAATVFLNAFAAPRQSIAIKIGIPSDATPGPALLRFCSADGAARWEAERAPRRFAPATVPQLVKLIEETSGSHILRVTLHGDAKGVVVDGREMQGLPESVFRIMDSNRRTGGRSGSWGRLLFEDRVATAYQLSGCQELRLEIKAKGATGGMKP